MLISISGIYHKNKMEYRGVNLDEPTIILFHKDFFGGSPDIANYLGIIHALGYCKNKNIQDIQIICDSHTAIQWIKFKKDQSGESLPVLDRANLFIEKLDLSYLILKWNTDEFGENPSDFEYIEKGESFFEQL